MGGVTEGSFCGEGVVSHQQLVLSVPASVSQPALDRESGSSTTARVLSCYHQTLLFNWITVNLQHCMSFKYTAKWFNYAWTYIYIYIYSFSDSFTLEVITRYWIELPVLCNVLFNGLSILYIVCVFVNPKLLIYLPAQDPLSTLVTISLFYISVNLLCTVCTLI